MRIDINESAIEEALLGAVVGHFDRAAIDAMIAPAIKALTRGLELAAVEIAADLVVAVRANAVGYLSGGDRQRIHDQATARILKTCGIEPLPKKEEPKPEAEEAAPL